MGSDSPILAWFEVLCRWALNDPYKNPRSKQKLRRELATVLCKDRGKK